MKKSDKKKLAQYFFKTSCIILLFIFFISQLIACSNQTCNVEIMPYDAKLHYALCQKIHSRHLLKVKYNISSKSDNLSQQSNPKNKTIIRSVEASLWDHNKQIGKPKFFSIKNTESRSFYKPNSFNYLEEIQLNRISEYLAQAYNSEH